jgi:hypothetical protein
MSRVSPTAEGFRAAFRRPSLTLAEIVWRWTVGAAAGALLVFTLIEYLNTLPVTNRELLLLRTGQPFFVGSVISHILHGSLNRVVLSGLLGSLALAGLWILASSVGRAVTVRGLLDYFASRRNAASSVSAEILSRGSLRVLFGLNFLRAMVALAAICGLIGAAILAGFASPDADPQPGLAFFLFLPLAGLVGFIGWALNWLLSLAGVFAVRDGEDAIGAISAAVALFRERSGAVLAVSTWTGLAHLAALVGAMMVFLMPLGFVAVIPWRLVVAGMIFVMLAYFAVADWLYMVRLAGYVCITEMPDTSLVPVPLPPPPPRGMLAPAGTIDRGEPILSDLPNLAIET